MTLFSDTRIIYGVTIYSDSTWIAEMAGKVGFEAVWIEMEHGGADFKQVEALCMAAALGGALPAVRICENQRTYILRALEVGARIVIVPMVHTPEQARAAVAAAKFPPLGQRGYNTRTRGTGYGLYQPKDAFAQANESTALLVQIETTQAVENLEAICAVPGLDGIFIGPGDLSVAMGLTAEFDNSVLRETIQRCVRYARQQGLAAGILIGPGKLLDAAIEAGCNLVFAGGDIMNLTDCWRDLRRRFPKENGNESNR